MREGVSCSGVAQLLSEDRSHRIHQFLVEFALEPVFCVRSEPTRPDVRVRPDHFSSRCVFRLRHHSVYALHHGEAHVASSLLRPHLRCDRRSRGSTRWSVV